MKKNTVKRLLAALMAASMLFALAACGGGDKPADGGDAGASTGEPAAAGPLTEDEYIAKQEELMERAQELQAKQTELDPNDKDAAIKLLDEMRVLYADLAAIEAPEKFADAHAKIKSGSEAMVAFIDVTKEIANADQSDTAKMEELTTKMQESMTTALTDLAEGSSLLNTAMGE